MATQDWNHHRWLMKGDTDWIAGCRWLQAWWRDEHGWPPGPRTPSDERLVASMLNQGCDDKDPYFNEATFDTLIETLDEVGYGTPASRDRLVRDLLSTEALRYNVFGPFKSTPNTLLPWVKKIDPKASAVEEIRFAWTPKKSKFFVGGTEFETFITYSVGKSKRFLGVVCLYADDLTQSKVKAGQAHIDATVATECWRDDVARRLDTPELRAFWLQTLLAQQLVASEAGFEDGRIVVLSHAADAAVSTATGRVRGELLEPSWLRWAAYDEVVDALEKAKPDWAAWFRTRYLDFSPVADLLEDGDPRLAGGGSVDASRASFKALMTAGKDVLGRGGAVADVASGKRKLRNAIDASGLSQRAAQLAEDLTALRQAVDDAAEE